MNREVSNTDVLRIMSQPSSDFGHLGPTEDPADIRAAQTDIHAQDAMEATQGADKWKRDNTNRYTP